jgi:hypothetical protein
MTDLDDGFGLGDFKHLAKQDQTAVYDVTGLLVLEREIVLVSKERLVGSSGDMVLENVEDQLIDDPELNLVSAHKPKVVRVSAVEANVGSINGCTKQSMKCHVVGSIEPLGDTLAVVGGYARPVREQIDARREVDFHHLLATRERGGVLVEKAISVNRNRHKRAPAIVLTLVL